MLVQGAVVVAFAAAAVVHQIPFKDWYIEDAAISFAFARNWALGEGLVPTPGAERTEGYSNFTWVVMLAIAEWLGFDAFQASKGLQYALAALTVPLTALFARECAPDERGHVPLVAAGYLATASTFAIWGACGLENALFNLLMALALWRSAVEVRTGGFPFAAFAWCLLAMTRPEAILYAAIAGALSMAFTLRPHGWKPTALWLGAFFVPFGLYHAIRYSYFAYEFPQTYYGKMGTKEPGPFAWNRRGWKYVRNWSHALWTAYFLPIWFLGLTGWRGIRGGIAVGMLALTAFWLVYPTNDAIAAPWWPKDLWAPSWWVPGRSWVLIADALILPMVALGGERGWKGRVFAWSVACAVLFFAVYTLGDWMKAWRWMNLLQVPLAVLFGLGVGALADAVDAGLTRLQARISPWVSGGMLWALAQVAVLTTWSLVGDRFGYGPNAALAVGEGALLLALGAAALCWRTREPWTVGGWTVVALGLIAAAVPNLTHTQAQRGRPETGPYSIKNRVDFVLGVADTLDLEGPIVDLDVDMGGHLWWGDDRFLMIDIAGLVDIPMAQHRFERAFIREYLFRERRPHFAHVHGGWAGNSRIPTHPEWRSDYVEIPGYPAGKQFHIGNHVRRDLFLKREWPHGAERRVPLEDGVVLEGLRIPSEPARARLMWLEVGFRDTTPRTAGQDLQLLVFATGPGGTHSWSVPLAFGWLPANEWRADEVWVGGTNVPIPPHFVEGTYDVGFVVMGVDGRVLGPLDPAALPEGAVHHPTAEQAVFAAGEVLFPGALTVVSLDDLSRLAMEDREEGVEHARRGRCEQAEQSWWLARKHRPVDKRWAADHSPRVDLQIATCWAWRAEQDPERAPEYLERARHRDRWAPGYLKNARPVADALIEAGLAAREAGDHEAAYQAFRRALQADPTRAWARRWAEQERAIRLGFDEQTVAARQEEREARRKEAAERRERANEGGEARPDAEDE